MTSPELQDLWRPVLASLDGYLSRIPDDLAGLDEPRWSGTFATPDGDKSETATSPRQLIIHLLVASYEVPYALTTGAGFDGVRQAAGGLQGQPPSALRAAFQERTGMVLEFIGGLDAEALSMRRQSPLGELSGAEALTRSLLHFMHHKGQLSVFMRELGVRPGPFLA